jgi:hypothetical protein
MKLFELKTFSYDKGYHKDMVKTGVIITPVQFINPTEISHIKDWEGRLLREGNKGTEITMKTKDTFIDSRSPLEFTEALNKFK